MKTKWNPSLEWNFKDMGDFEDVSINFQVEEKRDKPLTDIITTHKNNGERKSRNTRSDNNGLF